MVSVWMPSILIPPLSSTDDFSARRRCAGWAAMMTIEPEVGTLMAPNPSGCSTATRENFCV
eukprot:11225846-Alexandrium_andersonii.AAC.1